MQGTTSDQRRRGRPRTRWQDNITKWIGLIGDRLLRSVEDRSQWRKIVHEAANPRIEEGWRYKVYLFCTLSLCVESCFLPGWIVIYAHDWCCQPALMNAAIFGNVSSIMLRLYRGTEEYHNKCHSIREFIRFYRVPSELASRLLETYTDRRCRADGDEMLAVSTVNVTRNTRSSAVVDTTRVASYHWIFR